MGCSSGMPHLNIVEGLIGRKRPTERTQRIGMYNITKYIITQTYGQANSGREGDGNLY